MNNAYFDKWTEAAKKFQGPLQDIVKLNIDTWKQIEYLKPEQVAKIRDPRDLLEQQVRLFVKNGHTALNHIEKSFAIVENAVLSMVQEEK